MIGALVTLVSLNLTLALVEAGQVAVTLPVADASKTTPIALTTLLTWWPRRMVILPLRQISRIRPSSSRSTSMSPSILLSTPVISIIRDSEVRSTMRARKTSAKSKI